MSSRKTAHDSSDYRTAIGRLHADKTNPRLSERRQARHHSSGGVGMGGTTANLPKKAGLVGVQTYTKPLELGRNFIRETIELVRYKRYWAKFVGKAAFEQFSFYKNLMDEYIIPPNDQPAILEIGVGQLAYQTLLFHSAGYNIVGIDQEQPTFKLPIASIPGIFRREGAHRAIKSIVRHAAFDRQWMSEIEKAAPFSLRYDPKVLTMDASHMDFSSDAFDFIFSNAVFEHISDVEGALKEVNRVLRSSGVAYILVHLFPSLSGGHNIEWELPAVDRDRFAAPWDHLRENIFPTHVYLNQKRISEYRDLFYSTVNVIRTEIECEGEKWLTPQLHEELTGKGYSSEDLLTRTIAFYCRKRVAT